nr:MAG TPA: maintenance system killer protein [Caudoviricetes sp.]
MYKQYRYEVLMRYLSEDLKREYQFTCKENPDIEGLDHPLINLSDAFSAYYILADYFTDASSDEEKERMLVGIRSIDLLASALGRQAVEFGGKRKYTDPFDVCATLFFGIVKNHSFSDGNKRTALLLLLYQLQMYGYYPTASKKKFEALVLHVADNSVETYYRNAYKKFKKQDDATIRTISYLLREMTSKKNSAYRISPTMRTFCAALENCGVQCKTDNGKVKFTYQVPGRWFHYSAKPRTYVIPFHGWTRTVGAKTARETLDALGLYEQYASYQDLLDGAEPMYSLVDDFKEPLRRLKDK